MKKLIYALIIIILVSFLASCNDNSDYDTISLEDLYNIEKMQELHSENVLNHINETANTNYNNIEEAFKSETKKFNDSNSGESLYIIYVILRNYKEYNDYITEYYIEVFDRALLDNDLQEKTETGFTNAAVEYLKKLSEEKKYKEYQNFYLNLPEYFNNPQEWVYVLTWFHYGKITTEEQKFHLNALLKYEEEYIEDFDTILKESIFSSISELAYELGEKEIEIEYEEKRKEIHNVTMSMMNDFKDVWYDDIQKLSQEEKETQLFEIKEYEEKYSEVMNVNIKLDTYYRISELAYALGDNEMGKIYKEKFDDGYNEVQNLID